MEYIEDSSESEDLESSEWFIKKPFDPDDFAEVVVIWVYFHNFDYLLKLLWNFRL